MVTHGLLIKLPCDLCVIMGYRVRLDRTCGFTGQKRDAPNKIHRKSIATGPAFVELPDL